MNAAHPAPIVLASTSRYRRALLERLGLAFEAVAPDYDEELEKLALSALAPDALSLALAHGKARSVASKRPEALVIGSDQIAVIDGQKLDKPHTAERARAQLALLAGRTHRLVTSVVMMHAGSGRTLEHVDVHELTIRSLSDAQIADYVARDAPLDCAGAYRAESLGVALFEHIRGDDATAVVGLPLTAVTRMLAAMGRDPLGPLAT